MAAALGTGPGQNGNEQGAGALRIDKYLWYIRLAKSRSVAQNMAEQGYIRIDGRRIDRAHAVVRVGNVITLPVGRDVRTLRVDAIPHRRGPASEARGLYTLLGADADDGAAA